jgi:hypothetical protein
MKLSKFVEFATNWMFEFEAEWFPQSVLSHSFARAGFSLAPELDPHPSLKALLTGVLERRM